MSALSQLYLPGAVPLWCALFFGIASLWGYSRVIRGDAAALSFARHGYSFFAVAITLTSAVMGLALVRRDFRIEYVYQYTGLELNDAHQFAAFWAGQKGSFLVWLLWATLIGLGVRRSAGRDEAPVMGAYILTVFGLLLILVRENPFVMLPQAPLDGAGLNPLLQDDWMIIHPPVMFVGYALAAVPFCFAVAAMWRRDTDRWAAKAFPWALAGFLVLGTAILMGGYWAYKTLGWGGYWGWDPVENASLIPWLIGTVLIHGLHLERTKKRYRRANLILACLLFVSVLYGTFLTRSGVLADFSVHSFVDLGISGWLIASMAFFGGISLWMLATRLPKIPTERNEDPFLSRGAFLVLSTIVVTLSAILVTVGTSAPLLTAFLDDPGQVGPSFYNRVNMPLALLIGILLTAVPFLTWRGIPPGELLRKVVPSGIFALAVTIVSAVQGVHDPFHLLFLFLAASALFANLQKTVSKVRAQGFSGVGGYLAHVGVGVMMIGVLASSAYDQSAKVTLPQGEAVRVDDLELTFRRFLPRTEHEKERMEVEVVRDDGMRYLSYPKLFVNDRTRQLMANPHVKKTWLQDLYISPIQYEGADQPTIEQRLLLARGESQTAGPVTVRFLDFDLDDGDPAVQFASGRTVNVGARLEVVRPGRDTVPVTLQYAFDPKGHTTAPPVTLDDGTWLALGGIDPSTGQVQVAMARMGPDMKPARLSIDVTRKPLIALVWYGLYVVLAGGGLSTLQRFRQALIIDRLEQKDETPA